MYDTSLNARTVELKNCEAEQLHLSGRIQAYGALVVVKVQDWTITHVSDNAGNFLGAPPALFLGKDIRQTGCWSPAWELHITASVRFEVLDRDMLLTFIRDDGVLLIESEPVFPATAPIPIHQLHRSLVRPPATAQELSDYQFLLAQQLREVTQMDRVMLYRFREDWCGEVVAEAMGGDFGTYLGLRFPAGDIPAIARALYEKNPIRTIPDAAGTEANILSLSPAPPDLSLSDLRSVSPMHRTYLANMGVGASVSLPVLISGKLWGLVVGHSYHGPRLLSHEQRHCASLLTNAFSLGLANFQAGESLRLVDSIDRNVHNAMLPLLQTDSPLQVFADCAQALKSLLNADGLALAVGGNAAIAADGLSLEALADLDRWFVEDHQDALLMTDHLADSPVNGMNIVSVFSGALAIKSWSSKHGWLRFYWFRLSETQEIAWAGNPDKPAEPHGHTLGPRRSFEKWLEVRHGYSREWTAADRLSALRVRSIASRLI